MIGPATNRMLTMNAAMNAQDGALARPVGGEQDVVNLFKEQQSREEPVKLSISEDAKDLLSQLEGESLPPEQIDQFQQNYADLLKDRKKSNGAKAGKENATDNAGSARAETKSEDGEEVSEEDEEVIEKLKARDREVRTHEQQHAAAAGGYVRGGPYYEYQSGPDGQLYAIGGHVDLDVGPERTPEATIRKAQALRAAATAPSDPSGADMGVARSAAAMEQEARSELLDKQGKKDDDSSNPGSEGADETGASSAAASDKLKDDVFSIDNTGDADEDNGMERPSLRSENLAEKLGDTYAPYDGMQMTGVVLDIQA